MSWVAVGTIAAGTALSAGGGLVSSSANTKVAENQANAANAVLAGNIAKQQGFAGQNKNTLQSILDSYQPGAQTNQLADAQAARSGANVANISGPDTHVAGISSTAPAAVQGEIAKRMAATNNYAKGVAGAQGNLSGYGDTWLENSLNNAQGNRDIGVTNNYSEGRKALLKPEQDLAIAANSTPPSWALLGPLLTGAGSMLASAGGSKLGAGGAPASVLTPKTLSTLSATSPGGDI